jgi:cell division septation protein DedD
MARRDLDDDAPWLAEAAPAPRTEVSRRSLFWTVFIVLVLATIAAVGLVLLISKKDGGSTQGYMNAEQAPVITAEPGPFKVKPADPAGMVIEGLDGTMYTAGEGVDQGSAIDPSLAPEAPLPRPGIETGPPRDLVPEPMDEPIVTPPATVAATVQRPAPAPPVAAPKPAAPVAAPAPKPATPTPVAPPAAKAAEAKPAEAKPAARAGSVQLGAFSSEEKANAVWAGLAGKYGLSGKRIIAVESGGKTLYRLRAASGDPAATCAKLKAAGDACAVVE